MPKIEVPARPVTVTVTKWMPLPAALTARCADPVNPGAIKTNGDLLDAYLQNTASLRTCAAQVDGVREVMEAKP